MNRDESKMQRAIVRWWAWCHRRLAVPDERALFHVPNGGARSTIEAARFKREGLRAGVPDLWLVVPRHGFHGLVVELKAKKGRVSKEQESFLALLRANGYAVFIVRENWQAAADLVSDYLTDGRKYILRAVLPEKPKTR